MFGAGVRVPGGLPLAEMFGRLSRPVAFIVSAIVGVGAAAPPGVAGQVPMASGGPVYEAIVLDAETGQVLRELNPDSVTYPASLTKMMTLYLTFEALNMGRLRLDQYLQVSYAAAIHKPSKLGLQPGESVTVRDLILGIVTKSANDAAAVLAEGLGGSEPGFAAIMTQKARQLGMTRTQYRNASGLPDPEQLTTARDIARLALALYHDFPREYRYFSVREFEFHGAVIPSHDHLLEWYEGSDGIKTGYTVASGFNLATSAVRYGHRVIGVIMGGQTARIRDQEMGRLLDMAFDDLARLPPIARREAPATPAVAAATPTSTPAPPATPASAPSFPEIAATTLAPPQPATPAPLASEPEAPRSVAAIAGAAIQHLSPVSRAEAASVAPDAADNWGIQIGAYRGEGAAEQMERRVARLAVAKGREPEIVAPASGERNPLYRLRMMHFSEPAARAACQDLHRQGIACAVVRSGIKVASR
jgi:D-alanyl-D-alanine carboxypeptidase